MSLSNDLISQFVKATANERETSQEATVYGTIVEVENKIWVKLDGSDMLTPISSTAVAKHGERVTVMIKDHTATITGNMSSPSARTGDVQDVIKTLESEYIKAETIDSEYVRAKNLEAGYITADDIEAKYATIETLESDYITADDIKAKYATIETLESDYITADDIEAKYATIHTLESDYITADDIEAKYATIENLEADYANIDFANIGEAAIKKIFAGTGLIKDLVVGNQTITGEIVGVTISGDLIKGNTIQADKLVVKGSDGLYYALNVNALGQTAAEQLSAEEQEALKNGLHGSNIIAKTVTAEKISVSDLVAFDATIGGYRITDDSIYSGVKSSADNDTNGVYLGSDGQFAVGGGSNFLRFVKDDSGNYFLELSASAVKFVYSGQSAEETVSGINERVGDSENALGEAQSALNDIKGTLEGVVTDLAALEAIGGYIYLGEDEGEPCVIIGKDDNDFQVVVTNTQIKFKEGGSIPAHITNQSLHIDKAVIDTELQQGQFVWQARDNGNLGLIWKGGTS